jgi:hypothetical protein
MNTILIDPEDTRVASLYHIDSRGYLARTIIEIHGRFANLNVIGE